MQHEHHLQAVAWSPEGDRIASTARDGTVRVWEAKTGRQLHLIRLGLPAPYINGVAFSPDGRHLTTANSNGTAYVLRLPE
jgi:WD40 repeat protein